MAPKFPYGRDGRAGAARRRAGFSVVANVKAAMAKAIRREMKKLLFAGRERVPYCFCHRELTRQEATLEHIRPQSRGGPTEIENLTISCQPCNSERGEMGYEKFRGRKGQ
jgi:5-methylcytosine-specific restriction endonuclease McrA